jgi:hypothetical protein
MRVHLRRGGRLRAVANGTLIAAVGLATGITAYAAYAGAANTPASTGGLPSLAPAGQHTTPVLSGPSSTFSTRVNGWTPQHARLAWSRTEGHRGAGALRVVADSYQGGALSPAFSVTPGGRYTASAWVKAATVKATAQPALEFYDVSGAAIPAATQLGQVTSAGARWRLTMPVVGIAPAQARTARVFMLAGAAHTGDFVDDVVVTETTGTAARLVAPLTTQGRDILDATGQRVVLRGIEIEGLSSDQEQSLTTLLQEIETAQSWGANMIRLPLDEDKLVAGSCAYDSGYLGRLRQLVAAITAHGMLAELDLETFAAMPCGPAHLPPMPDTRSITFWQTLTGEFASNPLVGFDLFNEPHDVTARTWHDGGVVSYAGMKYLGVGMQKLYDTVRATGAKNLVFVSGYQWATDFPYAAPLTGTTNVVYTPHIYTCPSGLPSKTIRCYYPGRGGITDPTRLLHRFARLGQSSPLVVDEFGWPSRYDGQYNNNLIRDVEALHWSGWTAFAFDGTTVGMFDLVKNVGGPPVDPSPSGMPVMIGLFAN